MFASQEPTQREFTIVNWKTEADKLTHEAREQGLPGARVVVSAEAIRHLFDGGGNNQRRQGNTATQAGPGVKRSAGAEWLMEVAKDWGEKEPKWESVMSVRTAMPKATTVIQAASAAAREAVQAATSVVRFGTRHFQFGWRNLHA